MPAASPENHAAAAWVEGRMDAVQRQEFEAHLATCPECQAETATLLSAQIAQTQQRAKLVIPEEVAAPPAASGSGKRRALLIVIGALVTLILGFALGWSVWQMTSH
jgi:anti-sigma factor RsiW